jgi:hypothetical protein
MLLGFPLSSTGQVMKNFYSIPEKYFRQISSIRLVVLMFLKPRYLFIWKTIG